MNTMEAKNKAELKTLAWTILVWAVIFAIVSLFGGCSAQWHLAKALDKDPSIIVNDTVTNVDTLWNEVKVVDTVFKETYDTVELIIDEVKIRYSRDTVTNEVFIEADCPDCPEITKTQVITNTIIQEPAWLQDGKKKAKRWGWVFLGLVFLAIAIIVAKKFTNWMPF